MNYESATVRDTYYCCSKNAFGETWAELLRKYFFQWRCLYLLFLRKALPDEPATLLATSALDQRPPPLPLVDYGHHIRASLCTMEVICI